MLASCASMLAFVAAAASATATASAAYAPPSRNIMRGMEPQPESNYTVMHAEAVRASAVDLPDSFDAREKWGKCIHGVLDQGGCGSCWAFAATESLSDRLCIKSNGSTDVVLSPGDLLACETLNLGCTCGSLPNWAWSYLTTRGVMSQACVPYTSGGGHTQKCAKGVCTNSGVSNRRYYASSYEHCGSTFSPAHHVADIMRCVLDGPVDATFNEYSDFHEYTDGVYTKTKGASYEGLHSVKIIGYGHDKATGFDYWTVQNSWGTDWGGLDGFFRIRRGVDECSFERLVYTGVPKLPASISEVVV